jgi:H+/Cl- antiporter ClcA
LVNLPYARVLKHLRFRLTYEGRTWRRRLIFVCGGLLVGAAAVLMAKLSDEAQQLFRFAVGRWPHLALVLTPAGFALAALLAKTVFLNSQGSGIPQVIAARKLSDASARSRLVSLRVAFGKILLLVLGLLCGASTGREGPTVQVGASILFALGRFAPNRERGFLLAGGSAGVAAAFNTPLAGIVFGIEEMGRSYEARNTGLIIGAIIAAGLTSLAWVGDYTYFGTTAATLPLGRSWLVVPVCAAIGGLAGGIFSRIVILFANRAPGSFGRAMSRRPVTFAALCGLGVALCGTYSVSVHGTGYEEASSILHGSGAESYGFAALKFLATVFSAISGITGGIFAPSLSIGAGLGQDLTMIFHSVPVGALVLLGMVSYLAGVVQAPITSFVIVSEMTQDHAMIIPLMAASVIATAVSRIVCKEGLYHALARNFLKAEAIARRSGTLPEPPGIA